jgi:phosphoribosylaminoimidazole carboxylase PurE protein
MGCISGATSGARRSPSCANVPAEQQEPAEVNMSRKQPQVAILMGSDSDLPIMKEAASVLKEFGVPHEIEIVSAHRSPERAAEIARGAADRGLKVLIAGAGMANHLAGAMAAHTHLPVVGVPLASPPLNGLDALLSTVQMPPGVPVATVAVGRAGARNAGLLAVQILALSDTALSERLVGYKKDLARQVAERNRAAQQELSREG